MDPTSTDPAALLAAPAARRRFIPVRAMLPSILTLIALCAGLTAIRMAIEGRFEPAVGAIIFAAILDGVDGRVARLLKSTSAFGAQLDSLADFVNFGVAPALLLYSWQLHSLGSIGWIATMVLAVCTGLRLARFNAALDGKAGPPPPPWHKEFFTGMPAPAGAMTALLPLALDRSGIAVPIEAAGLVAGYAVLIGLLMVSTLPTLSGKTVGEHIPRELVLPLLAGLVLFVGLLVSYPYAVLAIGDLLYLAHLPFALRRWRQRAAADAELPSDQDIRSFVD